MAIQPGFRSIEAKLLLGSATALILLGLVGIGAYRSLQSYILATHRITLGHLPVPVFQQLFSDFFDFLLQPGSARLSLYQEFLVA